MITLSYLVNSSTAKSCSGGGKNSRSEGFLLAKHKSTQTPPPWSNRLPLQRHGFVVWAYPAPGSLCKRGWPRLPLKELSRIINCPEPFAGVGYEWKGKSCNEEVTEFCDNNEFMRLKWMKSDLECWSKRMCIHVGFYVIQYIWSCEVRWWTSPPQMVISPRTRVYIQGAVGSAIGVDSGRCDLVLFYRFLSKDLWIFPGWCFGYPT